jgi:hypothetical protein
MVRAMMEEIGIGLEGRVPHDLVLKHWVVEAAPNGFGDPPEEM